MEAVGPYQVVKELGRGAMGVVFEAYDSAIGRTVALKMIRCQPLSSAEEDDQLKLRFAREASAAGRLSHPHIVTVYQLGEHDGMPYLAMEYITGVPLDSMLAPGTCLSLDAALAILAQIASALDYAHAEGVVHRDIKPANILVKSDGTVKLTDFGIARITSEAVTRTGTTLGTVSYMAPEQIMGSKVDGRADQYSLAVVAYQMLAGKRPFDAPTDQALIFKIVYEEPKLLDGANACPPRVAAVLRRGLSKEPGQRYRNCSEFVADMRSAAGSESPAVVSPGPSPITVSQPSPAPVPSTEGDGPAVKPVGPTPKPRRRVMAAIVTVAIVSLAGLAYAYFAGIQNLFHSTPPSIAAGNPQLVDSSVPAKGVQFKVSVANARAGYQVQLGSTRTPVTADSADITILDRDPELINQLKGPPDASFGKDPQIALLDRQGRTVATATLHLPPALFDAVSKALVPPKTPPTTRPETRPETRPAPQPVHEEIVPKAVDAEKQEATKSDSSHNKDKSVGSTLRAFARKLVKPTKATAAAPDAAKTTKGN